MTTYDAETDRKLITLHLLEDIKTAMRLNQFNGRLNTIHRKKDDQDQLDYRTQNTDTNPWKSYPFNLLNPS